MVERVLRPCLTPGCPGLTRKGLYCETHRPKPSPYDRKWRGVRDAALRREPMCRECGFRRAVMVDHILAVRAGGARLDPRNLRPLCRFCHDRITYFATRDTHDLNVRFPKRRKRFS